MPKYVTMAKQTAAIALWEEGIPKEQIASQLKISKPAIGRIIKEANTAQKIKPLGGGANLELTESDCKEIIALYQSRVPMRQIQSIFKLGTISTIYSILRRYGIPRNGRRQQAKPGSTKISQEGYILRKVSANWPWLNEMGGAGDGSWKLEHRIVMADVLQRALNSNESIHHRDGNKQNNSLENLQLISSSHGPGCATRCRACGSKDIEFIDLG